MRAPDGHPLGRGRAPRHRRRRSCAGRAGAWAPRPARRAPGSAATGSRRASARCRSTCTPTRRSSSTSSAARASAGRTGARTPCAPATASCTARAPRRTRSLGAGDGLDVLAFGGGSATRPDLAAARAGVVERAALAAPRRAQTRSTPRRRPARSSVPDARGRSARRRSSRSTTCPAEDFTGGGDVGRRAPRPRRRARVDAHRRGPLVGRAGRAQRAAAQPRRRGGDLRRARRRRDAAARRRASTPVRAGSVVARPPRHRRRPRLPRRRRAADAAGLRHARAQDIVFYPRSGKVAAARDQRRASSWSEVEYWDGEA